MASGDAHGQRRRDEPRARATKSGGKRPPVDPLTNGKSARGRGHADARAEHHQQQRLGEHEGGDLAVGEPERLQDRQLRDALADRLRHGVAGQEQDA